VQTPLVSTESLGVNGVLPGAYFSESLGPTHPDVYRAAPGT
jgi:hypothetical protein